MSYIIMMGKSVVYTKDASKSLIRVPANVARTIRSKIMTYSTDPAALANNVIQLTGLPFHRLRVGDYRVIFEQSEDVMTIIDIKPRGSIYE